jgi:hydrogenase maturation protease
VARLPLVLGLGNPLRGDDAVGLRIFEALERSGRWRDRVEFVNGGAQGAALLDVLLERPAIVVLDAIARGSAPGTVWDVGRAGAMAVGISCQHAATREGGAANLLRMAQLTGDLPAWVRAVGVEPAGTSPPGALSEPVERALGEAIARAAHVVDSMVTWIEQGDAPRTHELES